MKDLRIDIPGLELHSQCKVIKLPEITIYYEDLAAELLPNLVKLVNELMFIQNTGVHYTLTSTTKGE